jgi:chromosome segregation ATPase
MANWKTSDVEENQDNVEKCVVSTSTEANSKTDDVKEEQANVENYVRSTSTEDRQAINHQEIENVMVDFQQVATRISASLLAASDAQKTLRLENENLKAELRKAKDEKDTAEKGFKEERAQWDEKAKSLEELFGNAKREYAEALEVENMNRVLRTELQQAKDQRDTAERQLDQVCGEMGVKIKALTVQMEETKKNNKEYIKMCQEHKYLRAGLEKLENEKAAAKQWLSQELGGLEGAIGSLIRRVEKGATQLMCGEDGDIAGVSQDLEEETQERVAKPDHDIDGVDTVEKQDLQSELQKLRQDKEAAEITAGALSRSNEILEGAKKKLAEDLEKEKSSHILHVKKVREELGAKHKKEVDALKTKYEKEIARAAKTADEPGSLRKENERLKVENRSLKKKTAGAEQAIKDAASLKKETGTLKDQLKHVQTECSALKRDLAEAEGLAERHFHELGQIPRYGENLEREKVLEQTGPSQLEELDETKEKLAGALSSKDALRELCTKLEKEVTDLKAGDAQSHLVNNLRGQISSLQARITCLETQVSRHQEKAKEAQEQEIWYRKKAEDIQNNERTKAPLVRAGAAIRLRFLAQAENVITGSSRDELDPGTVRRGNAAAHDGNGLADAALFHIGYLSKEHGGEKFEKVYSVDVAGYLHASSQWKKVFDCYATVQSSAQFGNSSVASRQEFSRLIGELNPLINSIEHSEKGATLIAQLEKVTRKITQLDRRGERRIGSHFVSWDIEQTLNFIC